MINDVDGLSGDAQVRHEQVELHHLSPVLCRAADQEVELHAEQDLLLHGQRLAQFLGPLSQVLRLLQRLEVKAAQFGVDGVGVIVAQVAERRVDFVLLHIAVQLAEPGKDLNEHRQDTVTRR